MSEPALLLFLYTETPLHVGAGEGLGAVDLPIMREKLSDLPIAPGSGIKGALREVFGDGERAKDQALTEALFGPPPPRGRAESDATESGESVEASEATEAAESSESTEKKVAKTWAGALTLLDARLLLLPVRSVFGGFAWVTGQLPVNRLARDIELAGGEPDGVTGTWRTLAVAPPGEHELPTALIGTASHLSRENELLLEDLPYRPVADRRVDALAAVLRECLPDGDGYAPFRDRLGAHLMVVDDAEFASLSRRAVEITTRVRIDPETGTVTKGALWTEENLPAESLLWSLARFERSRKPGDRRPADAMRDAFLGADAMRDRRRLQLGGDRTVGRGLVGLRARTAKDLNDGGPSA